MSATIRITNTTQIINNVQLVLANEVVSGSLAWRDGIIEDFSSTPSQLPQALDGEGGWLLPGLVELHTDNLDKFFYAAPESRLASAFGDEQSRCADCLQRNYHSAGCGGGG
ncbi:hypothetical protein DZJ_20770 [Dickeya ananatis]